MRASRSVTRDARPSLTPTLTLGQHCPRHGETYGREGEIGRGHLGYQHEQPGDKRYDPDQDGKAATILARILAHLTPHTRLEDCIRLVEQRACVSNMRTV